MTNQKPEVTDVVLDDEDIFDAALREAVRTGRVVRTKDSEGRDVYRVVGAS